MPTVVVTYPHKDAEGNKRQPGERLEVTKQEAAKLLHDAVAKPVTDEPKAEEQAPAKEQAKESAPAEKPAKSK